jgi:hypothetical protein
VAVRTLTLTCLLAIGCGGTLLEKDEGEVCARSIECASGLACVMGMCSPDPTGLGGTVPSLDGGGEVDAGEMLDAGDVDAGPEVDAGPGMDAGPGVDAGPRDAGIDSGPDEMDAGVDAGMEEMDAGVDAGMEEDAGEDAGM